MYQPSPERLFRPPIFLSILLVLFLAPVQTVFGQQGFPGSVDPTFATNQSGITRAGNVQALALQPDGKTVIAGSFFGFDDRRRIALARINADGSVDTTFGENLAGVDGSVAGLAIQPDGKILVAGSFPTINGVARGNIARVTADGATCGSGGLVGSQQSVGTPGFILQPGQSVQVTFTIGLPQLSRFRFFVNVFAFVNQSNRSARLTTISKKAGPGFEIATQPVFGASPAVCLQKLG